MSKEKKAMEAVIDCTPTWQALLPVCFAILENGSEEGKGIIKGELTRMAKVADTYNDFISDYRKEIKEIIDTILPVLKKTRLDFSGKHNNIKEWQSAHNLIKQLRKDLSTNKEGK